MEPNNYKPLYKDSSSSPKDPRDIQIPVFLFDGIGLIFRSALCLKLRKSAEEIVSNTHAILPCLQYNQD